MLFTAPSSSISFLPWIELFFRFIAAVSCEISLMDVTLIMSYVFQGHHGHIVPIKKALITH